MNPFQYTVQDTDSAGLNDIARRFGYQNYQQAGVQSVPSGNFDMIRPGDVINFGNAPRNSPIINSTATQWSDFNNSTSNLNSFVNTPDPYMRLFQEQRESNRLASQNAIASSTAATERATSKNEQQREATLAGIATAGAKTGMAPNSQYQANVMQGARDQFDTRFALLDQQEKLAIAKARNAQQIGDTAVLREELDYANKIRSEKARSMEEAQKMEWEKYKFENLSAAQQASETRMGKSKKGSDELSYTDQELRKLRAAGIDSNNIEMSDAFLYGEGEPPRTFTPEYIRDNYSNGELWDLAIAMGVPRNKNLSKQDEIDSLLSNEDFLLFIQEQLALGATIEDIISGQSQ